MVLTDRCRLVSESSDDSGFAGLENLQPLDLDFGRDYDGFGERWVTFEFGGLF